MLWCLASLNRALALQAVIWCELGLCGSIVVGLWALKRQAYQLESSRTAALRQAALPSPTVYSEVTQQALHAIETQFIHALEIAGIVAWERDLRTDEIFFTASRALGHPRRLPYAQAIAFVHPDDRDRLHQANQAAIAHQRSFTLEHRIADPHQPGKWQWFHMSAKVLTDDMGQATHMLGLSLDITALKEAELAVRASEAKFSTIFHENPAPAWISTLQDGRCVHANESLCQLLGYSLDEMLGQRCTDLKLWPKEGDLYQLRQCLAQDGVVNNFETTWRTQTGAIKSVVLSARVATLDEGPCLIGVANDITERKQTELRLQQLSQESVTWRDRYEVATWAGRQIVYEYDLINDSYTWGRNTQEILGYDIEEMPGTVEEAMGFIHPSDQSLFTEFLTQRQLNSEEPYTTEFRVLKRDGTYIWVEDLGVPQLNDQGDLVKVIGVVKDLSDIKAAEHALRNRELLFRAVFEQSVLGIAFSPIDPDRYSLLRVNQQLCVMLGYSEAELLTLTLTDILHPDDRAASLEKLQQLRSGTITDYQMEQRYLRKDGRYFWANVRSSILQGIPNMPDLNVLLIEDISDRKQLELEHSELLAQLRDSEARYLAILDYQTELITRFKADGTLLFVNDAFYQYYDVSPDAIIGKPYHPLIYPDDQQAIDDCLASLSPDHPVATVQHRVYVKGKIRWMEWTNRAIYDEAGNFIELQSVGRDIHEQKQATAALQESQAKFQRLVDDIGDKFVVFSHTGPRDHGRVTYVSDGVHSVFGIRKEDILDQSWSTAIDWLPGEMTKAYRQVQKMVDQSVDSLPFEMAFYAPDGQERVVSVLQHLVCDRAGQIVAIEGIVEDITERKQFERQLQTLNERLQIANSRLEELATVDSLTQVANRRKMEQVLEQEWQRCCREQQPLTLILLDIDCFKAYNDHYGHLQGDRCLQQVAQLLQSCMRRATDVVARYGGEEFLLILPNTDTDGAIIITRYLQAQLAQLAMPHEYSTVSDKITISLGIAVMKTINLTMSYHDAINIADQALYQAKTIRNAYHIEQVG